MGAPDTLKRLVDSFARNIDAFKTGSMNETQLRREYLDPFFTSLGWDVENKQGYAEAYKEVIHEYSLKTKDRKRSTGLLFSYRRNKEIFC